MPDPNPRRSFTLIELLVVITIIALLSGLSIPAIQGAMVKARNGTCVTNMRQLGQAMAAYSADNEMRPPYVRNGSGLVWTEVLLPYLGMREQNSGSILRATMNQRPRSIFACPESKALTSGEKYADYGINYIIAGARNDNGFQGHPLSQLGGDMGNIIAFADALGATTRSCGLSIQPWQPNGSLAGRHKGRANVAFFDYHMEAVDPLIIGTNSRYAPPWQPVGMGQ